MNVTQPDTEQQQPQVKFTIPGDWITNGTRMMKRCDHIGSQFVELDRRCRAMITEIELLIEGIEQVSRTVPTYQIQEEEKPEFIEDLEQEEEEIQEEEQEPGPKDETRSRV
jgi:hypothetical protein